MYLSAWLHAYAFPSFDLEERGFFPIVSSGGNTVWPQLIVSQMLRNEPQLFLFGTLSRKLSSQQVASTIHDALGGSPVARSLFLPTPLDTIGTIGTFSPFKPAAGMALEIVRQVRRMLSRSIEMSDPM